MFRKRVTTSSLSHPKLPLPHFSAIPMNSVRTETRYEGVNIQISGTRIGSLGNFQQDVAFFRLFRNLKQF
jgi:hypothetical protein